MREGYPFHGWPCRVVSGPRDTWHQVLTPKPHTADERPPLGIEDVAAALCSAADAVADREIPLLPTA